MRLHFLRVEHAEGFVGIFMVWATWTHEYVAIFVKIYEHRTQGWIQLHKIISISFHFLFQLQLHS